MAEKAITTADLAQFIGTENYYRHILGVLYTDGVQCLAEHSGAFWLIDAIASYQSQLKHHKDTRLREMQFWTLNVKDRTAVLTCVADSGEPPVVKQDIPWTDFPMREMKLWVEFNDGVPVILLPSEH